MNEKNRSIAKIIAIIITFMVVAIILIFMQPKAYLNPLDKVVEVEYGELISSEVSHYVDMKHLDDKEKEDVINNTVISTDELIYEKKLDENGKDSYCNYLAVGNHKLTLTYREEVCDITINVLDTVKPVFINDENIKETIDIVKDCKPEESYYVNFYKDYVNDVSAVTLVADDTLVDYSKEGSYSVKLKATDTSGNIAEKDIKVIITSPSIKLDKQSITITEGGTATIKIEVIGKEKTVKYTSSDNTIATVDNKGKVTGKKKGTTTMIAEANGVKTECKITVKEKTLSAKEKRLQEAKVAAKKLAKELNLDSLNEYDRAYKICEYLYFNVDLQNNQSNEAYRKNYGNEAYAALILKKAACSGFCKAVTLLCNECGLESKHINANKWTHQWNMVKVNGKWIVVDAQGGFFGMEKHPIETNDVYIIGNY